jgi:hypothetical protein
MSEHDDPIGEDGVRGQAGKDGGELAVGDLANWLLAQTTEADHYV